MRAKRLVFFVLSVLIISTVMPGLAQEYNEAPMLAEMVASGDLPAVAERLPVNPMVITPLDQIGNYGGTLNRALVGPADGNGWRTIVGDALFEWEMGSANAIPSMAASISVSDDNTVHTITLREGLRWSDGEPFTADDIVFFYDAVILRDELGVLLRNQTWANVAGTTTEIVKVDDITVEFRFGTPFALFQQLLAYYGDEMIIPAHYMGQFHPDFADEAALQAAIDESGLDEWSQLFIQKYNIFLNADLPVMNAWTVDIAFPANQMVASRNPYYWKVDTEGNQLPYIDQIVTDLIEEAQAITLRAAAGEIDFQYRHIRFSDLALLVENAEANNYQVLRWSDTTGWFSLYMNQTHTDPVMRDLMQNLDFRIALSVAINRDEMNEILYLGTGEISHAAGLAGDPYFVEGFGQRYLEYDVERSNELLDSLGLDQRDSEGFRLRSDGERLTLTISTYPFETGASSVDGYELVSGYWEAVGVRTIVDLKERALWTDFVLANEHDVAGYLTASVLWNINPTWYVPTNSGTYWAPAYGTYYSTNGESGDEPTGVYRELQDLYDELIVTLDPERNLEIGQAILRIHDENIFMIGTVKTPFQPVIVSNDLVNVVIDGVADFRLRHEGQSKFYQLSFVNP